MIKLVEVKRKNDESFESFLRRFNKRLIQSGKLYHARKIRFYQEEPNRNKSKKDALRRQKIRSKKEYLRRIGKLQEDF